MSESRRRISVLTPVLGLFIAGCTINGLMFKEDGRITIIDPENRADVRMPVVIRWTVKDLPQQAKSFAILVDAAPQPAGQDLHYIFRGDETCVKRQGCPTKEDLAQRGIYETSEAIVTLDAVSRREDATRGLEDLHEAIVILLDSNKRRIGESAGRVEFKIIRRVTTG